MAIGLTSEQLINRFIKRSIYWKGKLEGQLEAVEIGESPILAKAINDIPKIPDIPVELIKMTPYILAFADTIVANNNEMFKLFPRSELS